MEKRLKQRQTEGKYPTLGVKRFEVLQYCVKGDFQLSSMSDFNMLPLFTEKERPTKKPVQDLGIENKGFALDHASVQVFIHIISNWIFQNPHLNE